ncbi:MAG: glutathione S-transferase family protein [Caulobacteraceae bacterium]
MELIIGTKKWSTWSLRPWLAIKRTGVPYTETLIELREFETTAAIRDYNPSGLVPALRDGDLLVWDSLAICEYLHEQFPAAHLWPDDAERRAVGRSAAAEMHSGFAALRNECSMDVRARIPKAISPEAQADIRRIVELWRDLLSRYGGPFLLGGWSITDAFYTPVATRFRTYAIDLADYRDADGVASAYADRLLDQPDFKAWEAEC